MSWFTNHPKAAGMGYWGHMVVAARIGLRLAGAATAVTVHAVLPFVFTDTASRTVARLHQEFMARAKVVSDQQKS